MFASMRLHVSKSICVNINIGRSFEKIVRRVRDDDPGPDLYTIGRWPDTPEERFF